MHDHSLAEGEEEPLKDQHWACAAEDRQGLTGQQAEHGSGQGRAHKTFQHSLKKKK